MAQKRQSKDPPGEYGPMCVIVFHYVERIIMQHTETDGSSVVCILSMYDHNSNYKIYIQIYLLKMFIIRKSNI